MPAKGSKLKCGERYNPLNKKLYKQFIKETEIDIDFETFKTIIKDTNQMIHDAIAEEEVGVKLPENLGNIVVTKYKSTKVPTDWHNSKKLNKYVPILNLHSFGYVHHIKWFTIGVAHHIYTYKFIPYRTLTRKVSQLIKSGKKYFKWENTDFWSSTRMERMFNKFYKTEK